MMLLLAERSMDTPALEGLAIYKCDESWSSSCCLAFFSKKCIDKTLDALSFLQA
jgi:hypothetical protein